MNTRRTALFLAEALSIAGIVGSLIVLSGSALAHPRSAAPVLSVRSVALSLQSTCPNQRCQGGFGGGCYSFAECRSCQPLEDGGCTTSICQ